jgi:pimeloyl-ACP methyl ester carboxylesterase
MEDAQPAYAFHRQFQAALKFDARDKLSTIAARTLVITGSQDRIVPLEFSRRLSAGISGAQFKLIEGAGHLLHLERPKEVNASIISFLEGDSP